MKSALDETESPSIKQLKGFLVALPGVAPLSTKSYFFVAAVVVRVVALVLRMVCLHPGACVAHIIATGLVSLLLPAAAPTKVSLARLGEGE